MQGLVPGMSQPIALAPALRQIPAAKNLFAAGQEIDNGWLPVAEEHQPSYESCRTGTACKPSAGWDKPAGAVPDYTDKSATLSSGGGNERLAHRGVGNRGWGDSGAGSL